MGSLTVLAIAAALAAVVALTRPEPRRPLAGEVSVKF